MREIAAQIEQKPLHLCYERALVTSTNLPNRAAQAPAWQQAGLPYHSYNYYLRQRLGGRVQKVSLDAGFTCPNVDGTVAKGGCTFCDNRSFSPSRRLPRGDIRFQIDQSIARMRKRYQNCHQFLAYFQPATNTYAPVDQLEPLYMQALAHPQVVGLVIGTRPDCVPDPVLDLIESIAASHYVSVELGMQTMHDASLVWMNRGHLHQATIDAAGRCEGRGFERCAHLILGLPGESHADMIASAREIVRLGFDSLKIHNLYCVKNTALADQVAAGEVDLIGKREYIKTLVDIIEILPPQMVVERISGDAPPDYFIGPSWCLDKPAVRSAMLDELERRGSIQGCRWSNQP